MNGVTNGGLNVNYDTLYRMMMTKNVTLVKNRIKHVLTKIQDYKSFINGAK